MTEFFQALPPYIQALIAGIITWLLTALGAAAVFIF
ncbi:divalent heavy-metal cations transporter [Staphylococcus gallinarum]|nr:divalent heavy-metal cations transporter [Staphylococcus gallinarum]